MSRRSPGAISRPALCLLSGICTPSGRSSGLSTRGGQWVVSQKFIPLLLSSIYQSCFFYCAERCESAAVQNPLDSLVRGFPFVFFSEPFFHFLSYLIPLLLGYTNTH